MSAVLIGIGDYQATVQNDNITIQEPVDLQTTQVIIPDNNSTIGKKTRVEIKID